MVKARNKEGDASDLSSITVSGSAGDVIFEEGDEGSVMFVIEEGDIELKKSYAGEERPIALLGVGDFFGEMSLLEEQARDSTAHATTDYKIISVDHSTFDDLIQVNPEIAVRMLRKLSHRLAEVHEAESRALEIARGALRSVVSKPEKAKPKQKAPPQKTAGPCLYHETTGDSFALRETGTTTIGRFDRAAGRAPDIDFTALNEDTVSRRHARIFKLDDGFFLQEEIATNGTFVNGRKLKKGKKVKLTDGDAVAFGSLATVFRS